MMKDLLNMKGLSKIAEHVISLTDDRGCREMGLYDMSVDELNAYFAEDYVINEYDVVIYYEDAVDEMDDDLRENLNYKLAPCSNQDFFDAYAKAHESRFGEMWELAKSNPVY